MKEIQKFKEETNLKFHSINSLKASEIEKIVKELIELRLNEAEIDYEIVGLAIYGSRSRGLEKVNSDLDVVVELQTNLKEYVLFNILNEEPIYIEDILVDINPIRECETGPLEEYLVRAEKYLTNKDYSY